MRRSVGLMFLSMATVSTNGASGARSVCRVKSVRPAAVSVTVIFGSFSVALTPTNALPGATRSRFSAACRLPVFTPPMSRSPYQ